MIIIFLIDNKTTLDAAIVLICEILYPICDLMDFSLVQEGKTWNTVTETD